MDKVIQHNRRSRNKRLKIETELGMVYLVTDLTDYTNQAGRDAEAVSVIADEGAYIDLCYEDPQTGAVINVTLDSFRMRFLAEEK